MDLTEFITARLAEREAAAIAQLSWLPIEPKPDDWTRLMCNPVMGPFGGQTATRDVAVGLYVGRMSDPDRVRREAAAMRVIVAALRPPDDATAAAWSNEEHAAYELYSELILRPLAAIWADHPDYDPALPAAAAVH